MIYGLSRTSFARRFRMNGDILLISHHSKLTSNITLSSRRHYEETVKALNALQTNEALLDSYKKEGKRSHSIQKMKCVDTINYLYRTGLTMEQLDSLSVIHVAGTKGKGSTCAICESILRHHGLKTGFYSSPHMVAVRERIRINGKPLSEEQFTKYFWLVHNALNKVKDSHQDMPAYFKFLTIMAFNVFLIEKVDVAIVEVGIGGEYDCTNILRKVPVIGITSLGLDHTSLLGNTLEEIAWQKAGILKPGAWAFTVQQSPKAMEVLRKRATERNCLLKVVPPVEAYDWGGARVTPNDKVQNINASLALQLAKAWLLRNQKGKNGYGMSVNIEPSQQAREASAFEISPNMLNGLSKCSWPGRMQTINRNGVSFYLDGAHTFESIEICCEWFKSQLKNSGQSKRVLVFNSIGNRNVAPFLSALIDCQFDVAIFCPNLAHQHVESTSDQANFKVTSTHQQQSSKNNLRTWNGLIEELYQKSKTELENDNRGRISLAMSKGIFMPCLADAVSFIENNVMVSSSRTDVLVTGSLHLVGCMLSLLDPELSLASNQFYVEHNSKSTPF